MALYVLTHSAGNIYDDEAFGTRGRPVFASREDADAKLAECVDSWPVDAPARHGYGIEEYADADDLRSAYPTRRLVAMPGVDLAE